MKLKNAPERKRQRQLGALGRLRTNLACGFHASYESAIKEIAEREVKVLEKRTDSNRRIIRTKKNRSV